ncbi:Hypothetical protein SMAX5B_016210 [Scophthalmus maximus]|uniref:Uncharacterized protein n=1 Tax=Scophthalmus maximus TaxID=52904 RepID=A0A2U9BLF0_SCOMX|nr:Hypothetical protein SMAX5B_016210 [Scophthalmus maximus]KAF0021360.1 hypothetical protein F2P81_026387 [Scophthalmus maximus]
MRSGMASQSAHTLRWFLTTGPSSVSARGEGNSSAERTEEQRRDRTPDRGRVETENGEEDGAMSESVDEQRVTGWSDSPQNTRTFPH